MNINKKKIDLYELRDPKGDFCWADIAIDSGFSESGDRLRNWFRISISSDYGNWTYFWSHPGSNWRKFLCKVSVDYVAGKFGCDRWFNMDKTIEWKKQEIIEYRKDRCCTKEAAREAWDVVVEASDECYNDSRTLQEYLAHNSNWTDLWGGDYWDALDVCTEIDPGFRQFWDTTWQGFIGQLQLELVPAKAA